MSDVASTRIYFETRELCHRDVYKHLSLLRKSLSDLKSASKTALLDNTLYWQKEIKKIKLEKDQEWQQRMNETEAENKQLKIIIGNLEKSDAPKESRNLSLWEAENQVDHLSRELDRKLIQINRLQLALAEQSKAMFELERSHVLLYRQYARLHQKKELHAME